MEFPIKTDAKLVRISIALVWLYQGLWSKILGGTPQHAAVVASVPFIGPADTRAVLVGLGVIECGIALWVLSGKRLRAAAMVQTALLVGMNAAGIIWAWRLLPDAYGMIVQNFAFLVLVWVSAEEGPYAEQI